MVRGLATPVQLNRFQMAYCLDIYYSSLKSGARKGINRVRGCGYLDTATIVCSVSLPFHLRYLSELLFYSRAAHARKGGRIINFNRPTVLNTHGYLVEPQIRSYSVGLGKGEFACIYSVFEFTCPVAG